MVTSWPVLKLLREEEVQEGELEDAGGKKICLRKMLVVFDLYSYSGYFAHWSFTKIVCVFSN